MGKNKKKKISEEKKKESTQDSFVAVDVGAPIFQDDFVNLSKEEQVLILDTVTDIQKMTWQQVWDTSTKNPKDKRGLNWESIPNQKTPAGKPVASIRISKKFRARVCRDGRWMRFISLHPDHDSAY